MYPLSSNMSVGSAFLLIWVTIHFPFSTACLADERSYLLDFKAGLDIPSSSPRLSSWRGFNCCEWKGVGCDYHTSHVIRLELSHHNGDGDWYRQHAKLRPSLFDLHYLQHLDLSGNNFRGISIPTQLLKLQHLTHLDLSWNNFEGIPMELGNMSSLSYFDISYNFNLKSSKFDVWVRNLRSLEFLGMNSVNLSMASEHWGEALSGLANLTQIHLSRCGLSGKIPDLLNLTHLSHLYIQKNSFPFELPSWFVNMSSLVSLDLCSCDLKGSIPSNFLARSRMSNLVLDSNVDLEGNISFILSYSSSLVKLSLRDCNFGGVFPHSIANFSKLKSMDLRYNRLSGPIPPSMFHFPKLSELHLGYNELSGTIPDSILNMVSLKVLSLPSTGLRGNFSLQLLENLTRLEELNLSDNQLFINISTSWIPRFPNLIYLGLASCNIEGVFPAFLSQQYQLRWLDLQENNIVGNIPLWLSDLQALDMLNVSNNQLGGCLPPNIFNGFVMMDLHRNRLYGSLPAMIGLGILDLSDNEFNGSIPETIGAEYLSLSGNNLTGQIPSSICSYNSYFTLDLSKNKLNGMIPTNIGRCSQLSVLKLAQNVLEGEIPEEMGNLTVLQTLNLSGNKLQGIIPSSIANCTGLQVFDLGKNKFEGNIPVWIEKLTDLRILSLASNKFIDRIPPQLFTLQNLQILDLSGNQLSGCIPSNICKLYALINNSQSFDVQNYQTPCRHIDYCVLVFVDEVTVWIKGRASLYQKITRAQKFIDLSRNKLSGNIPLELGLLKGLISLNISRNNLSGSIPEALGAMAYLESLDLSENKLSGKIPSQLLNLTFLEVLNLSSNMLYGLIPQGKQFSTFEASAFLGNPNLYGPQLENRTLNSGSGSIENHNNTIVEDGDGDDVMDRWWAVGVGLCFGVGFATVIGVLCFHIKWRYICFDNMDNFIYYLFKR